MSQVDTEHAQESQAATASRALPARRPTQVQPDISQCLIYSQRGQVQLRLLVLPGITMCSSRARLEDCMGVCARMQCRSICTVLRTTAG